MCDYCDCRSRPLLEDLGRQHELINAAVSRLRACMSSGDLDAVRSVAAELASALAPHSTTEEDTLYPELARAGIPDDDLRREHRSVDDAIRAAIDDPVVNEEDLRAALDELQGHIHREEYDLFPAAHQLLSDQAWERIDATTTSGGR